MIFEEKQVKKRHIRIVYAQKTHEMRIERGERYGLRQKGEGFAGGEGFLADL